MAIRNSQNIS